MTNWHQRGQTVASLAARLTGAAALAALLTSAHAGTLTVTPVNVSLTDAQPVSALTLRNEGDHPTLVQAEVVAWDQAENQDRYTESTDLLVSPPIFTVPAHGSQVVRVALLAPHPPEREASYRLYLAEVPSALPEGDGNQLRVALRIGIPVMAAPSTPHEGWEWSAEHLSGNAFLLTLTNTGNVHLRLAHLAVANATKGADQQAGLAVLAGRSHSWTVTSAAHGGGSLQLTALINGRETHAAVPVASP